MIYFAKVLDGAVVNVISANPEFFDTFVDSSPGVWIQTAYNTPIESLRANFAEVGGAYDAANDVFIPPKPYPSWLMDTSIWQWVAPIVQPEGFYKWDELTGDWVAL
jgi:hypothetical protein